MVSTLSIVFMAVTVVISFGVPIGIFLLWRKKYGLKIVPAIVGAAAFILFAMALEQVLHFIVLRPEADGTVGMIENNPWLFVIYATFAAGIFEETGRFISLHILKKKYDGLGTGLSYGIGHGGIEAILLAGFGMISCIVMSVMLNNGTADALGDAPAVLTQLDGIMQSPPYMFLIAGVERISAMTLHISLSIFVLCAVKFKEKRWLYPAAVVIHALFNAVPAMVQAGMIENVFLVEGVLLVSAVLVAAAASRLCGVLKQNA